METSRAIYAASKETANTQPSSDDEQPEPTLVCSPGSSPTALEVTVTVVTNKGNRRKRQVCESEGDEVPATMLMTIAVKVENKISKFKKIQTPSN